MRADSQARRGGDEAPNRSDEDRDNRRHAAELRPLKTLIKSRTVGVALFDRNLRCQALNAALVAMGIVSTKEHTGKSIVEVFGSEAQELEPLFLRVLDNKHNFLDFQLTAQPSGAKGTRRWFVNFYAIKDESNQVWLVAATFSEVTKRSRAALHLGRAAGLRRKDGDAEPSLLGEEISELLAQSLKLARRSVELMDDSLSLRFHVSETRMETGLEPLHLFLTATRTHQSMARSICPQTDAADGGSEFSPPCITAGPVEGGLSRRERQVLNQLAAGKSNKEIGSVLAISTRTVETYRARLMNKLKLHSTAELVRYAIRNKFIEA
ncbi:MAG TPA: LuxR C-terminal-related transcriptional regulator [Candidatus Acidoferrum sp.]|nr:LuxR C-terminal-related transcriptional regulator [Candidatus Acidoferrum sp.]